MSIDLSTPEELNPELKKRAVIIAGELGMSVSISYVIAKAERSK